LPQLPEGLTVLNCINNQLSELPQLPSSLTGLFCDANRLTKLLHWPNRLIEVSCENNPIEYPPFNILSKRPPVPIIREWVQENPYNMVKSANKR
jgi:Leucine-rich repeat (LRR) protein